jgi:hypothetical protein
VNRKKPSYIRVDNGPEFIARAIDDWAKTRGDRAALKRLQKGFEYAGSNAYGRVSDCADGKNRYG